MGYPAYYDRVPRLRLIDPLADFLGALDDGLVKFSYVEAVKVAGHSCPTVAGAYLMTCRALGFLYGDAMPVRGEIEVSFRGARDAGTAGVVGNIASMLTGAAEDGGFGGLGGRFRRRGLLRYGCADVAGDARFVRLDTGAGVLARLQLARVPADPRMTGLIERCLSGAAAGDERALFTTLWQRRVEALLTEHWEDPEVLALAPVAPAAGRSDRAR